MAAVFNEKSVNAEASAPGIAWQRLLADQRVKGASLTLDRLTLAPGATVRFEPAANSLGWLQLLDGEGKLKSLYTDRVSASHSALLPPGFNAALSTVEGASLLYAEIRYAERLDPEFPTKTPRFTVTDWTREPVFQSERDGRKRILLVTPDLCATNAIRAAFAIYPKGSAAPAYHQEGADSFIYVVSGRGTASAGGQSFSLQPGELLHFSDGEQQHLEAGGDAELRFLVLYAPGKFETVWADPSAASAWRSTGRDIHGWETAKDERERRVFAKVFGSPFTR